MRAAVFVDRDNTLIHNDGDLGDPAEVRLIQGAAAAVASLRGLGYYVIVVTNQGGVARGKYGEAEVEAVNQRINAAIKADSGARIDRFYYCPYHPEASVEQYRREHPWRKPAPGMLLQARDDMNLDLTESWMIGDQMRDVQAGAAAGARTILLTPDAEEGTPLRRGQVRLADAPDDQMPMPTFTARNLVEAVRLIGQQGKREVTEHPVERDGQPKTPVQSPDPPPKAAPISLAADTVAAESVEPTHPKPKRQFRPWNAPSEPPAVEDPQREPPRVEAEVPPSEPPRVEAVDPELSAVEAVDPVPEPPVTEPEEPEPDALPPGGALLRQILHELRTQRGAGDEFSHTRMLAVILQLIAAVCFIGAFWVSGEEQGPFVRWIMSAIMLQLATIAALLFGK